MKYLDVKEVCEILRIKQRQTIIKYIEAGYIKGFRLGTRWRFPAEQFKNFGEENEA